MANLEALLLRLHHDPTADLHLLADLVAVKTTLSSSLSVALWRRRLRF